MAESGYMQDHEIESFMATSSKTDPRAYIIATILMETGMRISEVVGDSYDYYTMNGHKVAPRPASAEEAKALGYLHVKNRILGIQIEDINFSKHRLFIRKAKGNKAREIPISNHCVEAILVYLKTTARSQASQGQLVDITTQWARALFNKITKEANIRHVHPHLFRNTFSVKYLQKKGDIRCLQKLLGHTSLSVTEKYLKYVDQQVWDNYNEVMNKGSFA